MDIPNRILIAPNFSVNIPENINLTDPVYAYNNGKNWRIIPLNISQKIPVIWDTYYDFSDQDKLIENIITIYMCPFSLFAMVFFGKFKPIDEIFNNNLKLVSETGQKIIPIKPETYEFIRRKHDIRLLIVRNAISKYPDCEFIKYNPTNFNPLVDQNYLCDNKIKFKYNPFDKIYNPKQIIYIIEYLSGNVSATPDQKYKFTIIIPKTNSPDISKNGFELYYNKSIEKIKTKGGLIFPCFWFVWNGLFPNSKIINL